MFHNASKGQTYLIQQVMDKGRAGGMRKLRQRLSDLLKDTEWFVKREIRRTMGLMPPGSGLYFSHSSLPQVNMP